MLAHVTKQRPIGARFLRFGVADQLAQMLNIAAGMGVQEIRQGIRLVNQTIAPFFQQMHARGIFCGRLVKFHERRLNRFRVNFAHQFAQILQLAPASLATESLGVFYPHFQRLGHGDMAQLVRRQLDQTFGQLLQRVHLALDFAFAGPIVKFFKGVVLHDRINF